MRALWKGESKGVCVRRARHRQSASRAACMLAACVACMAALLALSVAAPAYAADGRYSIDELSTEIMVETDGTAHIVERSVLTFEGDSSGVVWYLHVPETGESVRISSVRVAAVDNGGSPISGWTTLQMIDSDRLQQGRNPGDSVSPALRTKTVQPWYSYNIGDGMIRCYFPLAEDCHTYAIEVDYTIAHRVRVYRDVAELYWRYVNDSLPVDSDDVNLQIILPVPEGTDPETVKESIQAWGHGPDYGTFSIGDNGTVTYHIDHISKGNYAEAHVIFPASWMTNMSPNAANSFSDMRGAEAAAEESEWVDRSKREAEWDNNVRVFFLVLAVVIILVGVVSVLRFGRSARSRRALVRIAATLAIVAIAENLFFREPLITLMLAVLAIVMALVSLVLPLYDEVAEAAEGFDVEDEAETFEEAEEAPGTEGFTEIAESEEATEVEAFAEASEASEAEEAEEAGDAVSAESAEDGQSSKEDA